MNYALSRTLALFLLVVCCPGVHATPPVTYYQNADGKMGDALKTALCGIIYNRTEKSYDYLWTAFYTTDVRPEGDPNAGKIWDMYSNITNYTPVSSGSTYAKEGDCYNREHSFPQSWFGSNAPAYTDLHHIYPTDGFVNGKRSNYPFGETDNPTYSSANGFSKLGPCSYPGYTGTVFEPADEYKGDFARTYFYMVTCYEEKLQDWHNKYSSSQPGLAATIDGSTYPGLATWQLDMLMQWAKDDPVSEKETARNDAVYAIQKNRNPFIDYPGLEEYVWGSMKTTAFSYDNYVEPDYSTPATVPTLAVDDITHNSAIATWTVCGGVTEYTLQLASDDTFTESSSGVTTLVNESFENGIPSGWTASSNVSVFSGQVPDGSKCIAFKGKGAYLITPLLENPSNVSFMYRRSGNTTAWSLQVSYANTTDGPWTTIGEISDATTSWQTFTKDLDNVGSVYIKFTDTRESGANERYIDLVQVAGGSSEPVEGSLIATETVSGTSHTFTGLDPETTYYVRVKGNAGWSNAVAFQTEAAPVPSIALNDDGSGNASVMDDYDGMMVDVTLQGRTLYKDGEWNTLCLPFDVSTTSGPLSGDNVQAMVLSSSDSGLSGNTLTLNFETTTSITAGTPFIIKWTGVNLSNLENPVFTGVTVSDAIHDVAFNGGAFKGTYEKISYTDTNTSVLFLGEHNTLYWPQPSGGNIPSIGACRAYFELNDNGNVNGNGVRTFVLNFGDDTTGILSTTNLTNYTNSAGAVYDLQGRCISVPSVFSKTSVLSKGVYINNGKKVVIK